MFLFEDTSLAPYEARDVGEVGQRGWRGAEGSVGGDEVGGCAALVSGVHDGM